MHKEHLCKEHIPEHITKGGKRKQRKTCKKRK